MLKNITTLKIQGANFNMPTSITLFDPTDGGKVRSVKAALLYGRNGTGKSTIAKAFRNIAGEDIQCIKHASIYDNAGNLITLTEEEKQHIFVFDEDYVYENVKLQEDHLDTIVMLGEAADLTEKIEKAKKNRDKAKNDYTIQDGLYKEYLDYNNPKSPKYYLFKLGNALRGDDCWAGRDKLIKEARQNTQVRDDTYKQFVQINRHLPYCGQNGYEGYLYRWHYKASQLTDLSSEEILKFDALEKELAHYPQNATEYNFLQNCNLYKKFVESNQRMLTKDDDLELFNWFYKSSRIYSTYNDNRNKYFSQLLQSLSAILY